jgi:hypothetical protein
MRSGIPPNWLRPDRQRLALHRSAAAFDILVGQPAYSIAGAGEPLDRPAASVSPDKAVWAAAARRNYHRALDDHGSAGYNDHGAAIGDTSAVGSTMEAGAASACCVGATEACDGAGK